MINLSAYQDAHLQNFQALVAQAMAAGMDLLSLKEMLAQHFEGKVQDKKPAAAVDRSSLCPSCGRGVMVTLKVGSDLVIVCRSCRYSQLLGGI